MKTVLFTFHPTNGVEATLGLDEVEAQAAAKEFARANYPADMPIHDAWLLKSWWLMKDDGRPFFTPKPWPLAGLIDFDHMVEVSGGALPEYLLFICYTNYSFDNHPFTDKEEARQAVLAMIEPHGGSAKDNEAGGITFVFRPEGEEEDIVIGYLVAVAAKTAS